MKQILACIALGIIFFHHAAMADDPITIELVSFTAAKPLPEEITKSFRFASELKPSCKLTFLVRGTNMAHLKPDSLKIYVLRTKDGRDVRTINGQPSHKELSPFDRETAEGRYAKFTLELDPSLYEELATLEIQGSLQIGIADGVEKLETKPLDITKKSAFELGPFKAKMQGEKEDTGLFSFQLPVDDDDEKAKPRLPPPHDDLVTAIVKASYAVAKEHAISTEPQKNFAIQLKGPLDQIADLRAIREDKPLSTGGIMTSGDTLREYEFLLDESQAAARAQAFFGLFAPPQAGQESEKKPATKEPVQKVEEKPVTIELTTWKNLRTVTIPFQHNVPQK